MSALGLSKSEEVPLKYGVKRNRLRITRVRCPNIDEQISFQLIIEWSSPLLTLTSVDEGAKIMIVTIRDSNGLPGTLCDK